MARSALPLFFVFLFFDQESTSGRAQCFAEIVDGETTHMERHRALSALVVDDHCHGASLDTLAKGQLTAQASRACVKPFNMSKSYYSSDVISCSNCSFDAMPECFL